MFDRKIKLVALAVVAGQAFLAIHRLYPVQRGLRQL